MNDDELLFAMAIATIVIVIVAGFLIYQNNSFEAQTEYSICIDACDTTVREEYELKIECIKTCEKLSKCYSLNNSYEEALK